MTAGVGAKPVVSGCAGSARRLLARFAVLDAVGMILPASTGRRRIATLRLTVALLVRRPSETFGQTAAVSATSTGPAPIGHSPGSKSDWRYES